jgi:GNAT superfamily N-acetyltransferase
VKRAASPKRSPAPKRAAALALLPATSERWGDLERLFGPRGACAGCWCMWWRIPAAEFRRGKGAGNRRALKRLVDSDNPPGLIAYSGDEPVGWIALAPREEYPRLQKARSLKPLDDTPVWSVTCFFVTKEWRRSGVSSRLLRGAIEHARRRGARMLEGYPVVSRAGTMPDAFAWTGFPAAYERAGFREAARPSASRRIMRKTIRGR